MHTKFKKHQNFREFNAFAPIFSNLMHEVFNSPVQEVVKDQSKKYFTPASNIIEYSDKYEIVLAVPGFRKEDMTIQLDKNNLVLSAEKKNSEEINFKHKEFNFHNFKRTFIVSDNIDKTSITASYNNGLLTVTLKKAEEAKPKSVEIL